MGKGTCPTCGATDMEFCPAHKIKIKGGWDPVYRQDVCFKCGYESEKYVPAMAAPVIIKMPPREEIKKVQVPKDNGNQNTNEKRVTFSATVGDAEISIKVGKEGLSKILSMFMEG